MLKSIFVACTAVTAVVAAPFDYYSKLVEREEDFNATLLEKRDVTPNSVGTSIAADLALVSMKDDDDDHWGRGSTNT